MTPLLYEVHTRQWLAELGIRSLADVRDETIDALAKLGVTHLWLMGVWPTGPRAIAIARKMKKEFDEALPGWTVDDVTGSPYSVAEYTVAKDFGGDSALAALRERLRQRGIGVILDFVPNHIGIDHAWVQSDHVVSSPTEIAGTFADGKRFVAHGKDPNFAGWIDTAQVEYRRTATRAAMRDVLASIAERCDGVRCDMAMLLLPEIFDKTWEHIPCEEAAADFWGPAIAYVKTAHPQFTFIAEVYWGLEARLCELGFDYAYDKELYDRLVHDEPSLGNADHARRVHFLENHDEPRAAKSLPIDRHRAAALLTLGLPGMRFLHHGQLDGARRFARIQLRRRADEPVNHAVRTMYARLFEALRASSIGEGEGQVLAPERAWDDNPTSDAFAIVKWPRDLVVVNLAPHRGQCRVRVPDTEGKWELVDRLGDERWVRDDMATNGLFLDLPARGAQLFSLQRMT